MRRLALVGLMLLASQVVAARAGEATACSFGGPTPGFDAVALHLPAGSAFLTLDLSGARATRPVASDTGWHLAQGIVVLDAATREIIAYKISSAGMVPRRVTLGDAGASVPAAEVPFEHSSALAVPSLAPGDYLVVAYGSDGSPDTPNEHWSAAVQVDGAHDCRRVGEGEVFDANQTMFGGGTQVYAPGAGAGDGATWRLETARGLVVGAIDAETQARSVSQASVSYAFGDGQMGGVTQALAPFVSVGGPDVFTASYRGVYPVIDIAGVALDV